MELLYLIILSGCYMNMKANIFFDNMVIFLFLAINYKTNILQYNQNDPISVLLYSFNIIIHLIFYQINIIINYIHEYKLGKYIIDLCYWIDGKYIKLKNTIIYYTFTVPFNHIVKFITKKIFYYVLKKINKPINKPNLNKIIKLESAEDINLFLDRLTN